MSFDDFGLFSDRLLKSGRWVLTPREKYVPRYFLNYVIDIAEDESKIRSYSLKELSLLNLYMFEDKMGDSFSAELFAVRLSLFATGVGFMEFRIKYAEADAEKIADFAFRFKKAKVKNFNNEGGKLSLYDAASSLIAEKSDVKLFFTAATEFKYECQCYHFIHIDKAPCIETDDRWLSLLKRSYHSDFFLADESDCDMLYKPYVNDHWAGSSEGIVNITYDEKNDDTDRYLHEYKYSHLSVDYYFLYLILLNQRFSCVKYITCISKALNGTQRETEELNKKIVKLKTMFAFNIISDDQIFQNVYSKMYKILGIDCLLSDILDNEGQIEILRSASAAKAEKLSSRLLFGISLLSVFSALVDAFGYFDRFEALKSFSTDLGLISTVAVVCISLVWIIKTGREK